MRLGVSIVVLTALAPLDARADVQACLDASDKGQRARAAGKLREARDRFLVCSSDDCPALVRRDCTQWQGELLGQLPSVVLGAKDRQGRDLFDVDVSMDDEPLVKKLDGKSVSVDPGPHTFKFELPGAAPVIERALVKEGEKARAITITFADVGDAPAPDAPPPVETGRGGHTVYPWIVVGAGAATAVTGLVILLTSPSLPTGCNSDARTCTPLPGESSAALQKRRDDAGRADAQPTEGLVVGAIGLGVAAAGLVWHFLEPGAKSSARAVTVSPWIARGSAGAGLTAAF